MKKMFILSLVLGTFYVTNAANAGCHKKTHMVKVDDVNYSITSCEPNKGSSAQSCASCGDCGGSQSQIGSYGSCTTPVASAVQTKGIKKLQMSP